MPEISCTQKVMEALCDCAERIMLCDKTQDKLLLAKTVEILSRSLDTLHRMKEESDE